MPFCKICFDAGNSDYSTHNIKFYNLKLRCTEIECPYLKNITCTRCGNKSHTASYCKEKIIKMPYNIQPSTQNSNLKNNKKKINEKSKNENSDISTNIFCILIEDDEEYLPKENINYTLNGEIIGKLSDIIWGKGIKNSQKYWSDINYI